MRLPLTGSILALVPTLVGAGACDGTGFDDRRDTIGNISIAPELLRAAPSPNRLLRDAQLVGHQRVTVGEIQALLQGHGSALAAYVEDGRSAAQWIVDESRASTISPIYMVARIETESGLISSGTLGNIGSATGCACPDGVACDPSVAGFGLQVRCAAELIRGYLEDLRATNETISGWGVGRGKWTLDPCWVTPANRATAALYTYTPWVGAYAQGCGTQQWGGSSLVALLVKQFASDVLSTPSACPHGDGLYCGGNGVAGEAGSLYRCQGGELELVSECELGCFYAPAGENDRCASECPFGDGRYCGQNGVGGEAGSLYDCEDGQLSLVRECEVGCYRAEPGQSDRCATECPYGDGLYCGGVLVGGDGGSLYQCSGGQLSLVDVCDAGCDSQPPGTPDRCN